MPRAPLPTVGVTFGGTMSRIVSVRITSPSSLLWAHATDHNPLPVFVVLIRAVFAGCCQSLLEDGRSRRYLYNLCMVVWTPTPLRLLGAHTRFFPKSIGLAIRGSGSARKISPPCNFYGGRCFEAAVIR